MISLAKKTNSKKSFISRTSCHSPPADSYQISLSLRFIVLVGGAAILFSFGIGVIARQGLLNEHELELKQTEQQLLTADFYQQQEAVENILPPLFVLPQKAMPSTRFTSKHFDTALSVGSDTLLSHRRFASEDFSKNTIKREKMPHTLNHDNATLLEDQEVEIHEPAGQHLLIDMKHVDGAFLNSEFHLAKAMIDLVDKSGLTMLSYHCHKLMPAGISCVGVLLESHVSFHTWPVQGVITLDLFTCGPNSLLNLLKDVRMLFGKRSAISDKEPSMIWAFKRRGFSTDEGYNPGISDLGTTLLGVLQFPSKEQVSFFQTPFQQLHIYNVLDPKYSHVTLDRRLYLDGVLQTRQRGQAAFSEALVHPAMLAHAHPAFVTIIGAGDGAALREVLKYASVERVEWMDLDQDVVEISQEWLWAECGDFLPNISKCLDDPRVNLYYEDGFEWFLRHYGTNATSSTPRQDVIIIDVLNPEDEVDFSEVLFDYLPFAQLVYEALSINGVLAVRLGTGTELTDPPEYWTRAHHVAALVENLERVGFGTIYDYEDFHGGILESPSSTFLVAFKNRSTVTDQTWFSNEALVDVKLHKRLARHHGTVGPPLVYFDGATMQTFQVPTRSSEVLFCRNRKVQSTSPEGSRGCYVHGMDPGITHLPMMDPGIANHKALLGTTYGKEGNLMAMAFCVDQLAVPSTTITLLQDRLHDEINMDDAERHRPSNTYNPFHDRNYLIHHCLTNSRFRVVEAGDEVR